MRREKFTPCVGEEYVNEGNGIVYRCIECFEDQTEAILRSNESGWKFKAHGLAMYTDGMIDWDFSTGGHFA